MTKVNTFLYAMLLTGWLLSLSSYLMPSAEACVICVPYPENTFADTLLEKSDIYFAREVSDQPYVFEPVEKVKGVMPGESIKLFCDSTTRRKLRSIPGSVVAIARYYNDEEWEVLTFADVTFQPFIRTIVAKEKDWEEGLNTDDRIDYFAQYLTSEHPRIREQAYLEVGGAPYSKIKEVAAAIPRKQIYAFLGNFQYLEWHNLYILMLGQSHDPKDHVYIQNQVESAARYGSTTNLSAWLTAYIESHSAKGIEHIQKMYFENPDRTTNELKQVLTSLSVQGFQFDPSQPTFFPFRDKIVRSYAPLLRNYPEMAGIVAKDLSMWQIRAHVSQLAAIRDEKIIEDPGEKYILNYYLSAASTFSRNESLK